MADRLLEPLDPKDFSPWHAAHLLNRAGFGGTPAQIKLLAGWGLEKSVDHLVNCTGTQPDTPDPALFNGSIMSEPSPEERLAYRRALQMQDEAAIERFRMLRTQKEIADRAQIVEIRKWWIKRLVQTDRPLEEKMTLFFHGHFATGYRTVENSYHMFLQNQLFRSQALGNFADLAISILRDPAMLKYLDNNESHKEHPNENLAREFMELFTMGEGSGYSEQDIKEGARCLTGYTFSGNAFAYRNDWHDQALKRILGKAGNFSGDDFARIVLGRNAVAEYLALKLYRFFVNDLPSGPDREAQSFISAWAKLFRRDAYSLRPMLTTLFSSRHFYDDRNVGALVKSPYMLAVGAVRTFGMQTADPGIIAEATDLMGQNLFFPPSVKGWDGGRSWINTSTLYVRQNLLTHLLTGRMPAGYSTQVAGRVFNALALLDSMDEGSSRSDPVAVSRHLLEVALARPAASDRVNFVAEYIRSAGNQIDNDCVIRALCLITSLPEYQLC